MKLTIDSKGVELLEDALRVFAGRAVPFATRNTVNSVAFKIRELARDDIQRNLTNRNKFTLNSVRVDAAKTLRVDQQQAIVGSIAPYMLDQEKGAQKTAQGSEGLPIATAYSAGEEDGARPRTRLPRRPNKLKNIQLSRAARKGTTRKQRNLIAVKVASESSRKHVFLDLGNSRKGIFRVVGKGEDLKVRMVHDMSKRSVKIPRRPWLEPATNEASKHIGEIYERALRFQLKRAGVF